MSTSKHASNKNKGKDQSCSEFAKTGSCAKTDCRYTHTRHNEQKTQKQTRPTRAPNPPSQNQQAQAHCFRCGENHKDKCTYDGICGWCKRKGHKEDLCHAKKTGKAKATAQLAIVPTDGSVAIANMIKVTAPSISTPPGVFKPPPRSEVERGQQILSLGVCVEDKQTIALTTQAREKENDVAQSMIK
jgi:hypothetical protein